VSFLDRRAARARSLAGVLACAVLGGAGCGGGDDGGGDDRGDDRAKPKRITIDVARKVGRNARVVADGIIDRPAAVAIRVSAAPKQRVIVTWGLSCPKTADGTAKASGGSYAATPPNVKALRLPRRKIAFCAVRGEARLSRRGRVKVTLLGSER